VRRILSLIPNFEFNGAARQLTLLASALPRDRFTVRVCVLGRAGRWAEELRRAGVEVEVFDWRRWIDPQPLLALRRSLTTFRPDVLHAWGLPALRILNLVPGMARAPLVVSNVANTGPKGFRLDWLDRWLLRRTDRVMVSSSAAAGQLRALGLNEDRIILVRPAVADVATAMSRAEVCRSFGLPEDGRPLVAVGPLEQHKGFREAIWAFDLLRHPHGELHLVLVGNGPDRQRLERFARAIEVTNCVHFVGDYPDVPALLTRAEAVWVPSRADTGHNVTLEAMAAGCPVIASRWPGLAEIVVEGETGFLIRPGDKAALARQTRRLLDDGELRQRMGETARHRAATHFSLGAAVARLAALYDPVRA
jgi:glycosyltransferase involved in cell wall biosynthesis